MDLLTIAKAERDRLDKVITLLEGDTKTPTAAPSPTRKTKPKNSPASKAYWTPARRKEMSDRIKALNAKKKKKA